MRARGLFTFLLVIPIAVALASPSFAQSKTSRKKKPAASASQAPSSGVAAKIRNDGAYVFAQPDFDSEVLGQLSEGQTVRVSTGTTGGFAKFHKVRVGAIVGYIAEIDVQVEGAAKKRTHKRGEKKNAKKKKDPDKPDEPMMFSRFVGLQVGQVSFQESIHGQDVEDNLLVYGLKITGPDVVLDGPIMDLNIALHYGAPSYYGGVSTRAPASGFLLLVDPLVLLPFVNRQDSMLYLGVGPVFSFSSFKVVNADGASDLSAFKFGPAFSLGAGFRVEKVALRLEGKYYIERSSYKGLLLSIQSQF